MSSPAEHGSYRIPLALLALGLGAVAMLIGSDVMREHLVTKMVDRVRMVGEIQTRVAISHLWIEELVTGDEVDRDEVAGHLQRSRALVGTLASQPRETWWSLLEDAQERALAESLASTTRHLERFAAISQARERGYDASDDVGSGSPIDVEHDAVFRKLLGDLRTVEGLLETRLRMARGRSRLFLGIIVLVWITIVGVAAAGVWSRARGQREAEVALRRSEAQLLQAQKMEAVGRLAGGLAHDINNHLAVIVAECELVRFRDMGADTNASMDAVLATAGKSSTLIHRLLAFSRKQAVLPKTVSVNAIVRGMERMLAGLIEEDVRLRLALAAEPWSIRIDPAQLEQLIMNLAVNARDAMPDGGQLVIETRNRHAHEDGSGPHELLTAGDSVVLGVSDTGNGIPPEIRDRIFEPFFTTKDDEHGSGLGLATVHGIVRQHGGQIALESTVGVGTIFQVSFPRVRDAPVAEQAGAPRGVPVERQRACVLLVEDNDELRRATHRILEALGHSVLAADTPEQALELFRSRGSSIDLVVSDVIMPGMDGKQLADRLRRDRPDLRVLYVSGYTEDVVLDRGIAPDQVDLLSKPFTAAALASKVEEILSRPERPG